MASRTGVKDVQTTFPYLARDTLYQKEKPFATDFIPKLPDVPLSNHLFDFMDLLVRDAQPNRDLFELEKNGFCFLRSKTVLTSGNADDRILVESEYYVELETALHEGFPEYTRFECLDYQVRKRSSLFPDLPGAVVESAQPAVLPHTDFSHQGCWMGMSHFFPGQEDLYKDKDFDILNVWRVLRGPNNDWPLAVCDYNSVNPELDVLPNDVLHEECLGENWLLQKSNAHAWYYLSDQTVEDLIVFRNVDSKNRRPRAFHAAFDSKLVGGSPRESIEVRVVAFR